MAAAESGDTKKTVGGGRPWISWVLPLALLALLVGLRFHERPRASVPVLDYSKFYALVQEGHVQRVDIDGQSVRGEAQALHAGRRKGDHLLHHDGAGPARR